MSSNTAGRETAHRPLSDRLNVLCAHIHQGILSWIPPYLSEMGEILDHWFDRNPLPEVLLPLITCRAVDGTPENPKVLRACTAILSGLVGLHILDDLRLNKSRGSLWLRVGREKAAHYASAFEALSNQLWVNVVHSGDAPEAVFQTCRQGTMIALAGRNRMLSHNNRNWQAYWKTAEMTSAHPYGHLAAAGAMLATGDGPLVESCRAFGRHLGLACHLLIEYQDMWGPGEPHDNRRSDAGLPILYGLHCDHPDRAELAEIVQQDGLDRHHQRVMQILDAIDAKGYLIWAALQERKRALEALEPCPNEEGKQLLKKFLESRFEQIPAFARGDAENLPDDKKVKVPGPQFDPEELSNGVLCLSYRSIGLGLRHQIRQTPLEPPGI
jgi:hypothetical protein